MIIKKYGDLPMAFAPDIGEVVEARRAPSEKFVRAVVVHVRRQRDGRIKCKVQWIGDDPEAGARLTSDSKHKVPAPIKAGTVGWVVYAPGRGAPLVRHVKKDAP